MCLGFWKPAPSCKHTGTIIGFLTYCLGSRRRYRDRNVGFFSVQLWRVLCKIYFFIKILNKSFSTFLTNVVNNFCVRWNMWPSKVLRMTFFTMNNTSYFVKFILRWPHTYTVILSLFVLFDWSMDLSRFLSCSRTLVSKQMEVWLPHARK